ncbi:hypothetical protein M0R45_018844 [Rubus argutus]|uniref:Arginine decarboxylase n=1 Tax=Rubus argutus TaxID=59490 RepID=A0AAW1X4H0_RUBAR
MLVFLRFQLPRLPQTFFHLGNNWNFKTFGRPNASFPQESSNLEPRKKEDKTRGRVTARSVTKDKILISNSQISEQQNPPSLSTIPKYIIPDYNFDWDIAVGVTPSQVETAIKEQEKEGKKPAAVFITSPTYHGICSNLSEITKLCHSLEIPVIVDESHGAHLGFHPHMQTSAMQQCADIAVQSTHKVLCCLTQSSMLHMSVLDVPGFPKFSAIDPLRLTIGFQQLGLSGYEADEILCKDHEIIRELVETQSITFVFNLGTCREHVQISAPTCAERQVDNNYHKESFADIKTSLIRRDAFFSGKRRVSTGNSLGEICGELICPYPTGIPVLIPGEIITQKALDYLLHVRSKGAVIAGIFQLSATSSASKGENVTNVKFLLLQGAAVAHEIECTCTGLMNHNQIVQQRKKIC